MPQDYYDYKEALKLGQKEYKARVAKEEDPYLPALDGIIPPEKSLGGIHLGVIQIPIWLIVGTKTEGRLHAFARNFMPIMEENTEFADKWEQLYRAHLSEGIRDSIKVYEYMNRYYVEEGNKRVSVMKYCGAYSIAADVIRVMPERTDDEAVQRYLEFVEFNRYTKINYIELSERGAYRRLLSAMGKAHDEWWTVEDQNRFSSACHYFAQAYMQSGGEKMKITPGDALLSYIQIYGYTELQRQTVAEIKINLRKMWEEIALKDKGDAIELKAAPSAGKKPSVLERVFELKPSVLKAAFIYDTPPERSGWISDHDNGRRYAQTVLGAQVDTSVYIEEDTGRIFDTIERAIKDGNKLIFTVTPRMLQPSLHAAVEHPEAVVMNCSLNISHRYVRTYYPRMYEVKFILGVLAGSLTQSGRLGYVCDYPIYGQIAGINAFALGAQMANPRSKVYLEWSSVKGAKEAALSLNRQHIHIISSQDTARFVNDDRASFGLSHIGHDKTDLLAVPVWKWGVYYERIMRSMLDSTIKEEYVNSQLALNYYWGMSAGVVEIEYGAALPPASRRFADFFRNSIIRDVGTPFLTPFYTQSGEIIGARQHALTLEQIIRMDYLVDNVVGSIPTYDELNEIGKTTVDSAGVTQAKSATKESEGAT